MNNSSKLIGILGGTYDPIHKAHVYVATALAQYDIFEKILIIPCYEPVHRQPPVAGPDQRLEMVQLAFSHYPKIKVDDREIKRKGPSYAIDTLYSLRQEYPSHPLCWILGSDAFTSFHQWHRWDEFMDLGHLVIVKRPGAALPSKGPSYELLKAHQTENLQSLATKLTGGIHVMAIDSPSVSAHDIRDKLARGESVVELLPSPVWQYIQKHKIYNI